MDEQQLRTLIADQLYVSLDRITSDADLVVDLGADSLTLAELLSELEAITEGQLIIDELKSIRTVGDLLEVIERE